MYRRAFTLLELMLTISLVVMLCTLALPSFFTSNQSLLLQELEKLEVTIRYLQQRALATQQTHELVFDTAANTYSYTINGKTVSHPLHKNLTFGALPGAHGPPGNPTTPITQALTLPTSKTSNNCFSCKIYSDWKLSPGAIYIMDRQKTTGGALTCAVSEVSYIRRYQYTSHQWILVSA